MKMHELPEACKNCKNLRCFSAYMDGSGDYACNHKVMCEHWKKHMNDKRKNCPIRHGNGNCTSIGGFCLAVNDGVCEGLRNAYKTGILNGQANNSSWHTGTPTEEGLYVVLTKVATIGVHSSEGTYILDWWDGYCFKNLKAIVQNSPIHRNDEYSWVKWQKIEETD